jgi:hypothetical protein
VHSPPRPRSTGRRCSGSQTPRPQTSRTPLRRLFQARRSAPQWKAYDGSPATGLSSRPAEWPTPSEAYSSVAASATANMSELVVIPDTPAEAPGERTPPAPGLTTPGASRKRPALQRAPLRTSFHCGNRKYNHSWNSAHFSVLLLH